MRLKPVPQEEGTPALPARRPPLAGLVRSIALNALVPLLLYRLTKRYVSGSDVVALIVAGSFPLAESIRAVTRTRALDPVAVLALLGILVSMAGVALGGNVKLLLIRESFFTGALGVACFASLLLPRPLMFYFGRYFVAGQDPERIASFDASWQRPYFRHVNRVITVVWGVAFTAEFLARVVLVYGLSPTLVLAISPVLLGSITIATIAWTFAYIRYANRRGEAMRQSQVSTGSIPHP